MFKLLDIEGVKELYILVKGLSFPILINVMNNWEKTQFSFLRDLHDRGNMTTLRICRWCENHNISYIVIYPRNILKLLMKDPKRYLCYVYLQRQGIVATRM